MPGVIWNLLLLHASWLFTTGNSDPTFLEAKCWGKSHEINSKYLRFFSDSRSFLDEKLQLHWSQSRKGEFQNKCLFVYLLWGPVRGKFWQSTWLWTGDMRAMNWWRPTDYCDELAKGTPMSRKTDSKFENWQNCMWMSCRTFARTLFGSNFLIMINNGQ